MDSVERLEIGTVFEVRDERGRLLQRVHNLVTDAGLSAALQGLNNSFAGISYMAVGTGTTAPVKTDTKLGVELVRVIHTRSDVTNTSPPALMIEAQFRAADTTAHIREVGLFGGDATGVADSGTLFNRAQLNIDNSSGTSDLTITATITITAKVVTT